jgi:hypothetical protein
MNDWTIDLLNDWLIGWLNDWMIEWLLLAFLEANMIISFHVDWKWPKSFLMILLCWMTFQNRTMTRMEAFAWRYRKSYSFHDWSLPDQFLITFWSNSDLLGDYRRIHEYMIKIDSMTNKTLIEEQKFIKIVRRNWHLESHRSLSRRLEDLRIWGLEDLRTWGSEDLRTWRPEDLRIITLMSVSEARIGKIIIQNLFLIHDVTFISNDLRYLSCRSDFSSNPSIKSERDDNFIPDVCLNIICDGNFTFNIMLYYGSCFWFIT